MSCTTYIHIRIVVLDTLLKNIPPRLSCKLVRQLNVPDALGRDWTAVADCLNLTYEEMVECSADNYKMDYMLDLMVQQNYRIENLLKILKQIKRYDVVELFTCHEQWMKVENKAIQTQGMCCQ